MPAREAGLVTGKEGYAGSRRYNMTTETEIPEPPERNQAPERLELVRQFVNTLDVEEKLDSLADAPNLKAWLTEKRLLGRQERVTSTDHQRAIEFRDALRDILLDHNAGD